MTCGVLTDQHVGQSIRGTSKYKGVTVHQRIWGKRDKTCYKLFQALSLIQDELSLFPFNINASFIYIYISFT